MTPIDTPTKQAQIVLKSVFQNKNKHTICGHLVTPYISVFKSFMTLLTSLSKNIFPSISMTPLLLTPSPLSVSEMCSTLPVTPGSSFTLPIILHLHKIIRRQRTLFQTLGESLCGMTYTTHHRVNLLVVVL